MIELIQIGPSGPSSTCVASVHCTVHWRASRVASRGLGNCFFTSQNEIRLQLMQRHKVLQRRYDKSKRPSSLATVLPLALVHLLDAIIACDKAQIMWFDRSKMKLTYIIRDSMHIILTSLQDPLHRWAQPIGLGSTPYGVTVSNAASRCL
jgi:hypothetical protein